jgi:hypothetical protein
MKSSIRILLVFLISASNSIACSWYPFGEDVRFSLMDPSVFDDGGMSPYYYTSATYGYSFASTPENDPNIALWSDYCDGKVDAKSIYEAIYKLDENEINSGSSGNKMIDYLRENDSEALDYVLFAKSCSDFNNGYSGWENDHGNGVDRNTKMIEALKRSEKVDSKVIKKRYRFLAVRLAFYGHDRSKVRAIYSKSFSKNPTDAIDYWALYFKSTTDEKSAERNYHLAQVFVNAPGKRFGVLTHFSREIPMDEVLKFANSNTERANVYAVYSVRDKGRSLSTLKGVQKLDPNHPMLDYLLIREVNKLEDWILTPRYTNFNPTIDSRSEGYGESNELIQERIKDDEKYGREVAEWIGTLNLSSKKSTWNIAEAYLLGISGRNSVAFGLLESDEFPEATAGLVKQFRLLFKVRAGAEKSLSNTEQSLLMDFKQNNYNLFLFAVSREYEFQKQFDVAAGLFSQVNRTRDYYSEGVAWKSSTGKETLSSDFFYSWFLYLDAEYSPKELQSVIDFAELKFAESRPFDQWQRKYLRKNIDKLYDLLGTKHVRQNNMDKAISAFEKVGGDLWKKHPYRTYLDANPFHADFYSGHKPGELDTIKYTKLEIAKLYKSHLQKAENPKTKNRAYYYFLVANCELNMSHYGNSWMMRRYFWTGAMNPNYLEDDDDFFRLKRAREFYQKAFDVSSKKDIKALCLRMLGRCEKHQLYFDAPDSWDFDYDSHGGYRNYFYSMNKSYKKLEKEYPNYAEELLSNCFSFERYFAKMEN